MKADWYIYFEWCKWLKWPDPAVVGLLMKPQQKPQQKPLHSPTHHEVMWILPCLPPRALSNCHLQQPCSCWWSGVHCTCVAAAAASACTTVLCVGEDASLYCFHSNRFIYHTQRESQSYNITWLSHDIVLSLVALPFKWSIQWCLWPGVRWWGPVVPLPFYPNAHSTRTVCTCIERMHCTQIYSRYVLYVVLLRRSILYDFVSLCGVVITFLTSTLQWCIAIYYSWNSRYICT